MYILYEKKKYLGQGSSCVKLGDVGAVKAVWVRVGEPFIL